MYPLSAGDKVESPGRPKQVEFPGESREHWGTQSVPCFSAWYWFTNECQETTLSKENKNLKRLKRTMPFNAVETVLAAMSQLRKTKNSHRLDVVSGNIVP